MGIFPQKIPTPNSQNAEDVLEQTEMIFHEARKITMQAFIKHKAYCDLKKPIPRNSQNNNMCIFYNRKLFGRNIKFPSENFDG